MSISRIKIGEIRRTRDLYGPAIYQEHGTDMVLQLTDEEVLIKVEKFEFQYPLLRENPGWKCIGYEVPGPEDAPENADPVPEPAPVPDPDPATIPEARTLRKQSWFRRHIWSW